MIELPRDFGQAREEVAALREEIERNRASYYADSVSLVSDAEFDAQLQRLEAIEQRRNAPGASGLPEVELSVVAVLDALKADRPIDWNAAVTQLRAGGLSRYLAPYATATGAPGR